MEPRCPGIIRPRASWTSSISSVVMRSRSHWAVSSVADGGSYTSSPPSSRFCGMADVCSALPDGRGSAASRGGRERLDQGGAIVSGGEVGRGERDRLVGLEREQRRFQLGEELSRRPPRGAGRWRERASTEVVRRVPLVLGRVLNEGGGDEEELEPVRVLERVVEPAERVAILVAVL